LFFLFSRRSVLERQPWPGGPEGEQQDLGTLLASLGVGISGWRLDLATGISADGRKIVGSGVNPSD
jgi:hypothetical protein